MRRDPIGKVGVRQLRRTDNGGMCYMAIALQIVAGHDGKGGKPRRVTQLRPRLWQMQPIRRRPALPLG